MLFFFVASWKIYRLVHKQQTLEFKPSPHHSLREMWAAVSGVQGFMPKLSQSFVIFMDLRFVGGWGKHGKEAAFWGFLMGAYSNRWWAIPGWVIIKKLFAATTKQMLEQEVNAVVNICIYSLDLTIFLSKRPFRDNLVNMAQILAASANLSAVVLAALPILFPEQLLPPWIRGPVVMWLTLGGTAIIAVTAILDPVFQAMGFIVVIGGKVVNMCNVSGTAGVFAGTIRQALYVRIQMIFLGRAKARAAQEVTRAHAAHNAAMQHIEECIGGPQHVLSETEWLPLVHSMYYAGMVYMKGEFLPGFSERYLVLKEGSLVWFQISVSTNGDPWACRLGSWSLYDNKVSEIDVHEASQFFQVILCQDMHISKLLKLIETVECELIV